MVGRGFCVLGWALSADGDLEASQARELLRRKERDASRGSPGSFSDGEAVASG